MVPDGNPATSPVTTIAGYFQCTWLCAHPTASSFTYAEVQFTVPDSATGIPAPMWQGGSTGLTMANEGDDGTLRMTFPFNTRVVVGSSPYPTISAVIAFYGLNATSTVGVPDPSIPEAASYMFVSGGASGGGAGTSIATYSLAANTQGPVTVTPNVGYTTLPLAGLLTIPTVPASSTAALVTGRVAIITNAPAPAVSQLQLNIAMSGATVWTGGTLTGQFSGFTLSTQQSYAQYTFPFTFTVVPDGNPITVTITGYFPSTAAFQLYTTTSNMCVVAAAADTLSAHFE